MRHFKTTVLITLQGLIHDATADPSQGGEPARKMGQLRGRTNQRKLDAPFNDLRYSSSFQNYESRRTLVNDFFDGAEAELEQENTFAGELFAQWTNVNSNCPVSQSCGGACFLMVSQDGGRRLKLDSNGKPGIVEHSDPVGDEQVWCHESAPSSYQTHPLFRRVTIRHAATGKRLFAQTGKNGQTGFGAIKSGAIKADQVWTERINYNGTL